jgi:SAM-dependent methyltransferase/WD40 repeat protein
VPENAMPTQPFIVRFAHDAGNSVISVSCTPNFSHIIAGTVDRKLFAMGPDGRRQWEKRLDHEIWATAISADSSRIAVGTAGKRPAAGSIYVLDNRGELLWSDQIGAPVWGVALSADGSLLAATAWDGKVYQFRDERGTWKSIANASIGNAGAYGVSVSADGDVIAAVSYGEGLKFLDDKLNVTDDFRGSEYGYRAKLTADAKAAIVGMRNGSVVLAQRRPRRKLITKMLSQRPICGVAIIPKAKLAAAGGFDGHVYVLDRMLDVLWTHRTDGEIWDVDISYDGRFVCLASGDGKVYGIENLVTDAALEEIYLLERNLQRVEQWQEKNNLLTNLREQYSRYGLIEYGLAKFEDWRTAGIVDDTLAHSRSRELLEFAVAENSNDFKAQYLLAQQYERINDSWRASLAFLAASSDPNLRQRAFTSAAKCFAQSNHMPAALSCFRRAREQSLHEDDLRVLYNLARSLEDHGNVEEARLYYDVLLTWNPQYRDVAQRANSIHNGERNGHRASGEVGYTGLTVSVMGPDAPQYNQVDPILHPVIRARARELHVDEDERVQFENVLRKFYRDGDGIREATRSELGYDIRSYIKYDYLLPEDEIKKELERLNTLALLDGPVGIKRSLDIGTATGRWARTFASRGVEAYGVDVEEDAIAFAEQKLSADERERGFPKLKVANALELPFCSEWFCLVTCMMGTFAHIARADHGKYFREAHRVLRQGGRLLISTWDVECRHQTYLSMYSFTEKRMIESNSLTRKQLADVAAAEAFHVEKQVPFCLIPDVFSFELGIKELDAGSLRQMLSIDIAARSNFPEMHGQMFLTLLRK